MIIVHISVVFTFVFSSKIWGLDINVNHGDLFKTCLTAQGTCCASARNMCLMFLHSLTRLFFVFGESLINSKGQRVDKIK